jgi:hypothetical protein
MPDQVQHAYSIAVQAPVLSSLLLLAMVIFIAGFVAPWAILRFKLSRLSRQVRILKEATQTDPKQIAIKDRRLQHLWHQYCDTLHLPQGAVNPRTGVAESARYRATVPAETIFNSQSVYEGRIHTEFFKHLPGLLTGLGIIGTFVGLIDGLGRSTPPIINGWTIDDYNRLADAFGPGTRTIPTTTLDTVLLIGSVKEAFYVSAAAIASAMVVTFVEKLIVAGLHRTVEQLCQDIDAVYAAGAGEEYLSRLVHASEESASQARILKDALVGELSAILERLTQQQISAIDQGLKQPLGDIATVFKTFSGNQGDILTKSLQDSMTAFAAELNRLLGGQVGRAETLQAETMRALQKATDAFDTMAKKVGAAGDDTVTKMLVGQRQLSADIQQLVGDMHRDAIKAQGNTAGALEDLLTKLGKQVEVSVGTLRDGTSDAAKASQKAIGELALEVRNQTQAIEQAILAMRGAVSELGSSVNRNVTLMGEGASEMRQAAEQFTGSGKAISEVFDRLKAVSLELSRTASALSTTSQDVQVVVSDYRAARETFAGIVEALQDTVATAKRDVTMTSDLVSRLEAAAQKLIAAERHADEYLRKLNEVLAEAHGSFSSQMRETLKTTNTEFHEHLAKSTSLLASTVAELDGVVVEFAPRRPAAE